MANNNLMESGATNYSGKAHERIEENKENKELNKTVVGESQYNSIKQAEGRTAMNSENNYNSLEVEGAFNKPKSTFIDSENLSDQTTENDIINSISDKLEKETNRLVDNDPYGFRDVIEKLIESAKGKGNDAMKEINNILDRTSIFISDYQEVLKQNLSEEKEAELIDNIFKKTMGKIVLSSDGQVDTAELLNNFKQPRDAKPGKRYGETKYFAEQGAKRKKGILNRVSSFFVKNSQTGQIEKIEK